MANQFFGITCSHVFSNVFSDESLLRELLERIFPDLEIGHLQYLEREKDIKSVVTSKGVRLDLLAWDDRSIFNLENQIDVRKFPPERGRYYHAMMDMFTLKEKMSYRQLKDSYLIVITPKDLVGEGAMMNVFRMKDTVSGRELNDRQTTVYINCSGKGSEKYPGLKEFCAYALTNEVPADADSFIQKIHSAVVALNQDDVWRSDQMTIEEYGNDMYETGLGDGIAKGKAEGKAEGLAEGKAEERKKAVRILVASLVKAGCTEEQAVSEASLQYPEFTSEEVKMILAE